jgi:hydroxymethylpyrimidine pyrophosphatase-like HAD family hydrolase
MNDAEMLSMAGKGCIMQNAPASERSASGAGSDRFNADNAVPKYLRKLFLE